jgi:hypothetical protein
VVVLRDGRKLVGVLRSWDQFGISHHRSTLAYFTLFLFALTDGAAV